MTITRPALRYHGAKFRLAPWIVGHLPSHRTYVEPFGGAAGVLLRKPRSYAEVYNDLDGDIVNLFRVLRDEQQRAALIELLALTPYARAEFDLAWELCDEPVERARRLCVRASQGFGSAGATKGTTGFRIDTHRAWATAQHVWARYPDQLAVVGERFAGVLIEHRPALHVMRQHDRPDTLHYLDPPYVHSTRSLQNGIGNGGCYRHEMSDDEHVELLTAAKALSGTVAISSYPNELYRDLLRGWRVETTQARIASNRGAGVRQEMLWLSPACSAALERKAGGLFAEVAA